MAYTWDNRVRFVVRYMYDVDNNGLLDKNDFACLAVRNTVLEGKGQWDDARFKANQKVMHDLWNEIAELADFNKVPFNTAPRCITSQVERAKHDIFQNSTIYSYSLIVWTLL